MIACTIDRAFDDDQLLGAALGDRKSWQPWRTVLKSAFGLPLGRAEARTFAALAGPRKPPRRRVAELWCVAGRRSGKSRMAALVATYLAVFVDYRGKLAPGETGYVVVLSPSKGQARAVKDYVEGYLRASPVLRSLVSDVTAEEIRLTSGIVIAVHAASHRTVRSRTLLAAVLDESAFFRDETSATPDLEIYRAVMPGLGTTDGLLVGISSPYRRVGLLHQKHRDHFGQDGDILVIQAATTVLNPTFSATKIEAARKNDPEAAVAEWDGEFRGDVSALLDDESIDAAINYDRPLEIGPRAGVAYFGFTDASAGRSDAFTLAIGHKEGDRAIIDVLRARKPPFNPNNVAAEFAEVLKAYGCRTVVGDNYAGEFVVDAYRSAGIQFSRSRLPKSGLYLEAVSWFRRGAVDLPDDPVLIRELRLLERQVGKSGKDRVDHPRGGSDDRINVVAGVLHRMTEKFKTPAAAFGTYGSAGDHTNPLVGHYVRTPSRAPTVEDLPPPAWVTNPQSEAQAAQARRYLAGRAFR